MPRQEESSDDKFEEAIKSKNEPNVNHDVLMLIKSLSVEPKYFNLN